MSDRRLEVTIPVTRDERTFEKRRRDMLTNLQHRTSNRLSERTTGSGFSDTTASSLTPDSTLGRREDWDDEVNRWTNQSLSKWDEQMRRMRQEMVELRPIDDYNVDHQWGNMGRLGVFDHDTDASSMFAKMEREMESVRQQMGGLTSLGSSRFPTGGSSKIQSSSSRVVTSSTTSSSGDPRNMQSKSNVQESVQHSRTIDGVTTGTSSHSSMSTTSKGPEKLTDTLTPGSLIPRSNVTGGTTNFLKDAYELDEDGQVHFKVRFDAKDFSPEDIDVSTVDNRLTVHAKKSLKSGDSVSDKEFCRTIDLPRSIDHDHFQCNLTEDGVLILDAPVKVPDYQAITFDKEHQLSIRPKSQTQNSAKVQGLVPIGITGPTILNEGSTGRKLHLEVPIDPGYTADDLCVRMDANRITVSGKHSPSAGSQRKVAECEFTRSFEVPETVDPFSVTAQLYGTTLIIEAPLLCTV